MYAVVDVGSQKMSRSDSAFHFQRQFHTLMERERVQKIIKEHPPMLTTKKSDQDMIYHNIYFITYDLNGSQSNFF